MTKVIFSKDIRKAFTDKVNEYLAKGMEISVRTMSGSQGEITKVDVTDGRYIYRIRLDNDYRCLDDFFRRFEMIVLTVEKFEDDGRNEFDTWGTLWSGKGEMVEEKAWFALNREKTAFVDTDEKMQRIMRIREERYESRKNAKQEITDSKRVALIYKMVKKHKGYASVNKKAIEKVVREGGYNFRVFFTAESKKDSLRI